MPRIFFASKTIAQQIAIALDKPWDGSNSVELYTEDTGFEETVEQLNAEWCLEGQCCHFCPVRSIVLASSIQPPFVPVAQEQGGVGLGLGSFLCIDESPILFLRDELKEKILSVEGVIKVRYKVEGERCFVFDALLDRVRELQRASRETPIAELVTQALPDAWMSAQKAAVEYKIVPLPYKLINLDGKLAILHEPFNSVLPPRFDAESDRQEALAQLLLGERLPGDGEFEFTGQAMTQLEPLNLNLLTTMPELGELPIPEREVHPRLEDIRYNPEMPLLTEEQFDELKKIELAWATGKVAIKERVYAQAEELWQLLSKAIDLLPQVEDAIPDYDEENARALRSFYPEFKQFSDSALYVLYDNYEDDIYQARSWEPDRSDGFLCYLFGCLADPEEDDTTRDIGEFVGYGLLTGKEISEAIAFAKSCWDYDLAMGGFCWYLRKCQGYLEEVSIDSVTRLTGERVGTFGDWIESAGRKARRVQTVSQTWEQVNRSPGWVGDD